MDSDDIVSVILAFALCAIIGLVLWGARAGFNEVFVRFSDADVANDIELVVGTDQYTILDKSNNNSWVGSPGDVTYNLLITKDDGTTEVVSCRCTNGAFQPLICRKYQ